MPESSGKSPNLALLPCSIEFQHIGMIVRVLNIKKCRARIAST
jgi:hypothetical protein